MWPRYLEMLVGGWLIASPWIFGHSGGGWFFMNDLPCGTAVILLAILSFFRPTRRAHIGIGGVALWLGGSAYFLFERPGPPAAQNEITIALLLVTLFLLPNQASLPPQPWRENTTRA
jgi:SPW repeat